jgi:inner membrane protein
MAAYLHAAPALALAVVIGPQRVSWPWWLVGALVAVAPDADMLLVRWHIDVYGGTYGHRGFTHSLGVAALLACAAWLVAQATPSQRARSGWIATYVGLCLLSHPLLDGVINRGICSAWLWPAHGERLCLPWRPVPMTGVPLFGAERLGRELLWLGTPLLVFTAVGWTLRRLIMSGCLSAPTRRETERHPRHRHP